MKVPNRFREPVRAPGSVSLNEVARILEIEAHFSGRDGFALEARALRLAANALKQIGPEISPAKAFGWPSSTHSALPEHKEGT